MKIVLLSAASSIHTIRWAKGLASAGHEVHLISQHPLEHTINNAVTFHMLPYSGLKGYYLNTFALKSLLRKIQPDILNAHYASGYGTLARHVGFHPYLLSVWGSDVYDFPAKSLFHERLIKKNLKAADSLASTSHCMAERTREVMGRNVEIAVTPFGVEIEKFLSKEETGPHEIIIGTVKTLAAIYGIDNLVEAFALAQKHLLTIQPELRLRLRIVGGGPQLEELKTLANTLKVSEHIDFLGPVSHQEVPVLLSKMDVFVALSKMESFGVAVIEAGAAGLPVIVSDAGGLSEVTVDGVTGFIVKRNDNKAAAKMIIKLCQSDDLRQKMGRAGNKHVTQHYAWPNCIQIMLNLYLETIQKAHTKLL